MVTLFQTLHTLSYVTAGRVSDRLERLKKEETGASAVEYALLIGLIAVVLIVTIRRFGTVLQAKFDAVSNAI